MKFPYPDSLRISVQALQERLAEDLNILCVREVSTVADYFVLATANSAPHLMALSEEVTQACKRERLKGGRKGGQPQSGWIVVDFGTVLVHIMTRELREFYALEKLWSDAKTLAVNALLAETADA